VLGREKGVKGRRRLMLGGEPDPSRREIDSHRLSK